VYVKAGRYGPYVQLGEPQGKGKDAVKPKMVSLLKGMEPADVDMALALKLLELPRILGADAEGKAILAGIGRYGPYIKRGTDFRSLTKDDDVLTVGLDRALELLAQEKRGRGARATPEPMKVFEKVEALGGVDVKLLEGRYGPYVTDGTHNGSLPKGMDPAQLTVAEVVEIIEAARARGPRKKKPTRRRKS
jgi:DNA topoisomerase-1